ncbi:hypothetical protein [Neorhizobium huautlense]|uniref:hypothetical protein n=1 Tax=Neorhizobium huautlense TaxID=67774 RepID=UPI000CF8B81A|nr:hypothetical protein [Neorhizobium huautlense]
MDLESGELIAEVIDPVSGSRVVFEDDGRVAYAYLLSSEGEITSDVWLYNRSPTPKKATWHDRKAAPFLNPAEFVRTDIAFALPEHPADIMVVWDVIEKPNVSLCIHIHEELVGILATGSKPGWSLLAANDGPLARKFPRKS